MIRSAPAPVIGDQVSGAVPRFTVPRGYGFRILPRDALRDVPVGAFFERIYPWPVKLLDLSGTHPPLWVVDDGWYGFTELCGPWMIDPDDTLERIDWDVTWATEPGEFLDPGALAANLRNAAVLWDQRAVATGASITGPILDTREFSALQLRIQLGGGQSWGGGSATLNLYRYLGPNALGEKICPLSLTVARGGVVVNIGPSVGVPVADAAGTGQDVFAVSAPVPPLLGFSVVRVGGNVVNPGISLWGSR